MIGTPTIFTTKMIHINNPLRKKIIISHNHSAFAQCSHQLLTMETKSCKPSFSADFCSLVACPTGSSRITDNLEWTVFGVRITLSDIQQFIHRRG